MIFSFDLDNKKALFIQKGRFISKCVHVYNGIKDKEILRKYTFEKVFDINLMSAGISYTPSGEMIVNIKLDKGLANKDLAILYISSDGTTTEMKSSVKDGYIRFETSHFSTYAIVSKNKDYKGVKTGDTTQAGLCVFTVLCGGFIAVLAYRKSKEA